MIPTDSRPEASALIDKLEKRIAELEAELANRKQQELESLPRVVMNQINKDWRDRYDALLKVAQMYRDRNKNEHYEEEVDAAFDAFVKEVKP